MPNVTELGTIQIDSIDEYGDHKINGILDAGFFIIVVAAAVAVPRPGVIIFQDPAIV